MGEKSQTKKSAAAAASERGSGALPPVVLHNVDNTVCALCNEKIDLFHWDLG